MPGFSLTQYVIPRAKYTMRGQICYAPRGRAIALSSGPFELSGYYILSSTHHQRLEFYGVFEVEGEQFQNYMAGNRGLRFLGLLNELPMFMEMLVASCGGPQGYQRSAHLLRVNYQLALSHLCGGITMSCDEGAINPTMFIEAFFMLNYEGFVDHYWRQPAMQPNHYHLFQLTSIRDPRDWMYAARSRSTMIYRGMNYPIGFPFLPALGKSTP